MSATVQLCELSELVEPLDRQELEQERGRLARVLKDHFQKVWRVLRRCGLSSRDADEAAQDVFWILSRRVADVPVGAELSFLVGTAVKVAADRRRRVRHLSEVQLDDVDRAMDVPDQEELLALRRARRQLDWVLGTLSEELRSVFVLSEMEQFQAPEVAQALGIPIGTVASRLRLARQRFDDAVRRIHERENSRSTVRKP